MDQNLQLIDKYFQGELDKEELQLFNQKLQDDPAFEQEFRDMKLMRDAVKETSRIKALDIIMNAEANLSTQETTKINVSMKRLVSIAASLLIIATVSYFALSERTGALTGEEIVATYYEPYINLRGTVRGGDSPEETLSARAYNAYDVRDFSTAADLFTEVLDSEKSAMNYLYSGISNFEVGNYEAAKNNLNTVMNNFTELKEQAQWYLAMTLFKDGEEDQALSNLALFALSENSTYSLKSRDILAKMNMSLSNAEEGNVGQSSVYPDDAAPSPSGVIDIRRYQTGILTSMKSKKDYEFFNDFPIDGLRKGDIVRFVLMRKGNKSEFNNEMAVILGRLSN